MGFTAKEGRVRAANDIHNGEHITGFKLVLFTNAVGNLTENSTAGNVTEPSGGGYNALSIGQGGWTVDTDGNVTRPDVDFIATGTNYSAAVTGCALLCTYNSTDYLYGVQYFAAARTMTVGNKITINLDEVFG